MTLPLLSLFLAGFAIATSSFVVAGLLPEIALDLGVTVPTAGLLVTAYAFGVAVGGPFLALFTSRFRRKPTILALMAIFVAGQIFCALAPTYELLLAARLVISLSHGTFFGLAAILAVTMVPPERRGMAISLVFSGITVATVIGVPGGTAIGHAFGWRMAFWGVAAIAVVAAIVMAIVLPLGTAPRADGAGLDKQVKTLGRQQVWLSYAVILILMLGVWTSFTYISPLLRETTGLDESLVPWFLLIFGVGSTAGLFAGGRLDRWNASRTLVAGFAAQIVIYFFLAIFIRSPTAVAILLFLMGFAGFVVNAPIQNRVLRGAAEAPDLASTLMSSMFNIGIATGASLGAILLTRGVDYGNLLWVSTVLAIPATLLCLVAAWLDARPKSDHLTMPIALYALAIAAFAIGTTEFIVSGILPLVSTDLSVSIPTAGLLVTGYAAGVALIGPILVGFVSRFPAKGTIVVLMTVFAIGQVLCALAPDYTLLLAARLISAGTHGVFFGVASVAATRLVPPERRGTALSLFIGGITIANILGLPAGTAIGQAFGWRVSFIAIAALALIATVAIALTLPRQREGQEAEPPFALQAAQVRHPAVWATYLAIVSMMIGALAFGTFQVPILTEITGINPSVVPLYLLLGGAGAVIGIFTGGRLADWRLMPSMVAIFFANAAGLSVTWFVLENPVAMAVMMVVNGAFGFMFSTPCQLRILKAASAAPNLASTLISTAYNIGIALGAVAGALMLTAGYGYTALPLVGIVCSLISGFIALASWSAERRTLLTT